MCRLGEKNRENAGSITVFTTLFLLVFLVFAFFMLELVCWRLSDMKALETVEQNIKSLFGDFDSQVYEDYHLLILDASYGTDNAVYMEERMTEQLSYNLSGGSNLFRINLQNLCVSEQNGLMEQDYAALKKQIHDYCGYAMTENVLDMIKQRNDSGQQKEEETQTNQDAGDGEEIPLPKDDVLKDPREFIGGLTGELLLSFVCPKEKLPSAQVIDLSGLPSCDSGIGEEDIASPAGVLGNDEFDKLLGTDTISLDIMDCALEHMELMFYISSTFHSYLDEEVRVLQAEQEYILYGGNSDQKNLLRAVNGIILLRLPFNYMYLRGSASKMAAIQSAAVVIAALTQTSPVIVSKALTGVVCYGESVLDVRALLHGEPVALKKTAATWKLSITDLFLNKLKGNGIVESAKGLYYEDYLMLLMLKKIKIDAMYARVLDLITLNIQKKNPAFSLRYAITKATVSYQLECQPRFSPLPKSFNREAYIFLYDQSLEY